MGLKHVLLVIAAIGMIVAGSVTGVAQVPGAGASTMAPVVDDLGWPRVYQKDGQTVTVYQPQVDEWKNYARIKYRAAVSILPAGAATPNYGVIAAEADTATDPASRNVTIRPFTREVRFPNLPAKEEARLAALVTSAIPTQKPLTMSLDEVLAYVNQSAPVVSPVEVSLDPPPIFFSTTPAVLLMFMGPPEFKPVAGTPLMFAVNTNWDVFLDTQSNQYFLLNDKTWLTAPDPVKGPWTRAARLPDFSRLPNDPNWEDVRAALPGVAGGAVPTVLASTQPAELIVVDGAPKFSPISGTNLMYVTNTESPLFLNTREKSYYYLVAGRWFRAKNLEGPWGAATADLPGDFVRIPEDSPMAYVLASVPGTEDARDAVLVASIPQTASVNRKETTVNVVYEGEPKFVPIEGTAMTYAVNTPNDVIKVDTGYYCCYQGVWFVAYRPIGPWVVCTAVPKQIYTIPVSCPLYNVTYVRVYSYTPETVVVGYTSGYTGQYVAAGVVMFGAGIIVGAVIANNNDWHYYSHYRYNAHFYSYGCGAIYRGGYGGYYRSAQVYGPYGGAGRAAVYNPATGAWGRAGYVYGPNGGAYAKQGYNPQTGVYAARAGGTNAYGSWSRGVVSRGDDWVAGGRNSNGQGTAGWVQTSNGRAAVGAQGNRGNSVVVGNQGGAAIKTDSGDIYAGKDGNAYRRQDGEWQKNTGSGWGNAAPARPTPLPSNLSRDSAARTAGSTRATRNSPSTSGARSAPAGRSAPSRSR